MIERPIFEEGRATPGEAVVHSVTVGELVVRLLERWGVTHAFGVISIHNMPMLDPLGVRGTIAFVPARGEAGAMNMADAYARVSGGLGVVFTSTGTAAGNAAGAMVEALTAGSSVLHITGQVALEHLDRDRAYIHEAPAQLAMLKSVSKAAFRVTSPEQLIPVMVEAAQTALSAPTGPVSIEIPVDVQSLLLSAPTILPNLRVIRPRTRPTDVAELAGRLKAARRPMLLLGGGARGAEAEATALADLGVAVVTSTNGRGIVSERHPMSVGAFNCTSDLQTLYDRCDLLIVAGSRLRGNETWTYKLRLPQATVVIDCNEGADGRTYPNQQFILGDVKTTLGGVATAVAGELLVDPALAADVAAARVAMHDDLRAGLGVYGGFVDAIQAALPEDAAWVRDVTISNSTWGNRYLKIGSSRSGVHAVGGGIGQGLPMAIGAALASRKGAFALSGDGGLTLCLGELAVLAETQAKVTLILMNDRGYGVIRNIQDVDYGGRRMFADILVPDFALVAQSFGLAYRRVASLDAFRRALDDAEPTGGPAIIEIDMVAVGPYPRIFAGPPKFEE